MKIKVSAATALQLDWMVAKCKGGTDFASDGIVMGFKLNGKQRVLAKGWGGMSFLPSTDWAQGGPILTDARISRTIDHSGLWVAYWTDGYTDGDEGMLHMQCDRSELVAGLRCYVISKLGEEVEVPEELT